MEDRQALVDSRSGRRTVIGILAFGFAMVGAMGLYWEMYTRPYRPLQNAIAAAYPGVRPSVIGGRHKSHQPDSPKVLRIVLQMSLEDFNPEEDVRQRETRALELARLANQHQQLDDYDELEIHLVQRPPEQLQRHWSISHSITKWEELLAGSKNDSDSP